VGGDGDDACLSISGDTYSYVFDHGDNDCPAGRARPRGGVSHGFAAGAEAAGGGAAPWG
jgi:hypothetical protein